MPTTSERPAARIEEQRCIGDTPVCCQPSPLTDAEWNERTERLRVAHDAALAAQPKRCPECGSTARPVPTFDPLDEWECVSTACLATWRQDDGG